MKIEQIFKNSCTLALPYINFDGRQNEHNPEELYKSLTLAIEGFYKVIAENPTNWSSFWFIGKCYQALNDNEKAYTAFLEAHTLNRTDVNVLRELSIECLCTDRADDAVYYCQAAIEFAPDDYTLIANMATARFFQKRIDEAILLANKCLEKLPDDLPTKNLLGIIELVQNGTIEHPKNMKEFR